MDSDALSRLHSLCFCNEWKASEFKNLLSKPGVFAWLIRDTVGSNRSYGGFVLARIAREEAEIISIGVAPNCRGQGLGSKLLLEVELQSRTVGVKELFLEVAETNYLAVRLYKSLGFNFVGRRIGYYADQVNFKSDALIMRRRLI